MRIELHSSTRVRSCEDILQGRRERVEIVVNPFSEEPVILVSTSEQARALARALRRHANFIDPPKPRGKK